MKFIIRYNPKNTKLWRNVTKKRITARGTAVYDNIEFETFDDAAEYAANLAAQLYGKYNFKVKEIRTGRG